MLKKYNRLIILIRSTLDNLLKVLNNAVKSNILKPELQKVNDFISILN